MLKKFAFSFVLALTILFHNVLNADVVILESGQVITGSILQQDAGGVLIQMDYGTFRYPLAMVKDVRKEAIASPSESVSGQRIPNWAKIISSLCTNS